MSRQTLSPSELCVVEKLEQLRVKYQAESAKAAILAQKGRSGNVLFDSARVLFVYTQTEQVNVKWSLTSKNICLN